MKLPTLATFLAGSSRNAYIHHRGWDSLYVRRTQRFGFPTIDLANITAAKPGNGAFTKLVKHLRTEYPQLGIFVECVLNKRFEEKLKRMGFDCPHPSDMGASFWLSPLMELKDERREEDGAVRQAV